MRNSLKISRLRFSVRGVSARAISVRVCSLALFAALAAATIGTPARIAAQEAASGVEGAVPVPSAHHKNPLDNPAVEETPSDEERQEHAFLHPPIVKSLAKTLNMNEDVLSWLLIAFNFAIIFFGIGIPIARMLPKIMRQRTQTLQADIKTAREATEDANSRLKAVEAKLAGLGQEIEAFKAQVEKDALEDEKRIKASIEEESQRIVASAEQEISAAAAQARRGLRNFAAELAIEQATKQLVLSAETDSALIAEFVSQTSAQADGQKRGGQN